MTSRSKCEHDLVFVWVRGSLHETDPAPDARRNLRQQCRKCGLILAHQFKHSLATSDTPETDLAAFERAKDAQYEERQLRWEEARRKRESEWKDEQAEWWDRYNSYLCSPEWQARRALVFDRAGDICEGCRERRATQVHHLTYSHVTNEFLWQLVAICEECHARFHDYKEI
jgi:5-methylcytosine-specific restriction endonuclease McrA